jgi:hypothetical protein
MMGLAVRPTQLGAQHLEPDRRGDAAPAPRSAPPGSSTGAATPPRPARPGVTHAVDLEIQAGVDPGPAGAPSTLFYRWSCCCGKAGPWHTGEARAAARSARDGGRKHVAAMERG